MALDSLRPIAVIPASSKAAQASTGASSGGASFGAALVSSGGLGSNSGLNSGSGLNSQAASNSHAGSHSGVGSGSATHHDATGTHGSNKAGAAHSSNDTSSSNAKDSGQDSGSHTASSNAKPSSNARSKQGTSQSQTDATHAAAVASSIAAGGAASAKGGANAQGNTQPATFLETLAQSQANAATAASAAAPAAGADGTDADATARANGKPKTANDKDSDATSPSSLAFISQSLAATIAGVQQSTPAQANATTRSMAVDSDSEGDATEAISLGSNSSAAVQKLATTLANDTADALKAAADANSANSGPKSDSPASASLTADGSSAAVSAFQAQMSISSHFQQPPTPDSSPNRINAPVGSPAFNDELGGKVTWLASQGIQSASVQLSPEHLGPLSVHISVEAGSASVSFNAAHADTRAALEQALPRLREMFATNGLTLSDANVSHQSPRDKAQKQSISAIGATGRSASEETTASTATSVAVSRLGLVDTYV